MPVIVRFGRLRQEDCHEFETSLGYMSSRLVWPIKYINLFSYNNKNKNLYLLHGQRYFSEYYLLELPHLLLSTENLLSLHYLCLHICVCTRMWYTCMLMHMYIWARVQL